MELEEAIEWAEYMASPKFGDTMFLLNYYVVPWNDEYVVYSENHMKRYDDEFYVYDTARKKHGVKKIYGDQVDKNKKSCRKL